MSPSSLRSAWFVSSLSLFALVACGGRTLGIDDEPSASGQAGASASGKGGSAGAGGSVAGKGGTGGVNAAGTGGVNAAGTGGVNAAGTGGVNAGGTGGNTGKGGKGGNNGKGGNTGKGGTGGTGSFQSCDQCQQDVYPQCEPLYNECFNDPDCGGLLQCFDQCGNDDACANDCFDTWNQGGQLYYQLAGCFLCGPCEKPCDSPTDFCDQFGAVDGGQPGQPGQPLGEATDSGQAVTRLPWPMQRRTRQATVLERGTPPDLVVSNWAEVDYARSSATRSPSNSAYASTAG
jgi:hypothetical protein